MKKTYFLTETDLLFLGKKNPKNMCVRLFFSSFFLLEIEYGKYTKFADRETAC